MLSVTNFVVHIPLKGLYQESAYYEHNEWEDGLLSRYRRPGARFLNLFKRCVHWDMITDTWSDDFECSEELAFICMQPGKIYYFGAHFWHAHNVCWSEMVSTTYAPPCVLPVNSSHLK